MAFRLLQNRILHSQTFPPRTYLLTYFFLRAQIKWQIGSRKTLPRYELAFMVKAEADASHLHDGLRLHDAKNFFKVTYNFHSPPLFISKLLFYSICREILGIQKLQCEL